MKLLLKKTNIIKSPLRYPGGKSKAINRISQLIPYYEEYREPFVGGGSLFFYLKQEHSKKNYWINDLYFELFTFWQQSRDNNSEVVRIVESWKKLYDDGKTLHKYLVENIKAFTPLYKAAAFFVFNRITFSGTSEAGGYSEHAFKLRFTDSSIRRLMSVQSILENVNITNHDYSDVVNVAGREVFVFLDPPYHSSIKSSLYGKNGILHKKFDHERFANTMRNCNHNWLITYDDSEYIRELFTFANIFSWDLRYGMKNVTKNSNNVGNELFISNYLSDLPENLQLKLL